MSMRSRSKNKKSRQRVEAATGETVKGVSMSNLYFTKKAARSQVFVRVVEGIIEMVLILAGIAAVCYLASAVFRALGVA